MAGGEEATSKHSYQVSATDSSGASGLVVGHLTPIDGGRGWIGREEAENKDAVRAVTAGDSGDRQTRKGERKLFLGEHLP